MSDKRADLKYPMVDLFTDATMSLMYLNMLTASYLMLLSTPWVFMQAWIKGFEGGSEAAPKQKELRSDNRQLAVPSLLHERKRPARSTSLNERNRD